jgi:exonuclease III
MTETWHSASDDVRLRLATPDGYAIVDVARSSGRGGDVAVIYRKHLKCSRVPLPPCDTFEAVCVRLMTANGPVVLLNIYRPGSVRSSASFCDELASVLEVLVVYSCPVVVGGDINIHVHNTDDPETRRLH